MRKILLIVFVLFIGCNNLQNTKLINNLSYPFQNHTTEVVDLHVFREGTEIVFINESKKHWISPNIWINQRYVYSVDEVFPGQTVRLKLDLFVDHLGESFSAGGFFAIKESSSVHLLEIELPDTGQMVQGIVFENKNQTR